jgi:hypothetical protein
VTLDELKRLIDDTTPEERLALAAHFRHVTRKDDPAYRAELFRLNQEIDDGKRLSLDEMLRLHDATLKIPQGRQ